MTIEFIVDNGYAFVMTLLTTMATNQDTGTNTGNNLPEIHSRNVDTHIPTARSEISNVSPTREPTNHTNVSDDIRDLVSNDIRDSGCGDECIRRNPRLQSPTTVRIER